MQKFCEVIKNYQSFLVERVSFYIKLYNYEKFSPSKEDGRVVSIVGLSEALINAVSLNGQVPEINADHDFAHDPLNSFGIIAARKHRQRGISLEMFLGAMKYFRQAYLDMLTESVQDQEQRHLYMLWVNRFFDHTEIAFSSDWTAQTKETISRESEEKLNRYYEIVNMLTKKPGLDANLKFISPEMQSLVKSIEKYAKVDASVLITGESGVGKEVVADLIHQFSDRKDAPFFKINCGAIPETLLESELFGYEEGAFSGSKKGGKIGIFELVDKGTVLLDEIGDLPLSLQVKILRFVQSRDFYRVGGNRLIKVNTRIIAATNRDLDAMVHKNEFRSDLFYRLQVLTIHIPALRERSSDILPLTQHFMKIFNEKYSTQKTLSPEVYRIFTNFPWMGNVRELENFIERLIVTTDVNTITAEWIPDEMKGYSKHSQKNPIYDQILTYKEAKEEFERQYFQQAIETYGSARKVGEKVMLDHSTIVKKAAKYGINLMHWQKE